MAKRVNTRLIRTSRSYDTIEAAEVCGVTVWTVRNWIKQGLPVLDEKRPMLIAGEVLRSFLKERQAKTRCKLRDGEFYCTSCKAPSFALDGEIEVQKYGKRLAVRGRCQCCEAVCSRFVSAAQLTIFAQRAAASQLSPVEPKGTPKPILKSIQGGRVA